MNDLSVARVSTVKFFIFTQLGSQLESIRASGANLTVITSDDDNLVDDSVDFDKFNFIPVHIPRNINLLADFRALLALVRVFKANKFDIVHSTTPKAGLLCAIAGKIAGIKVRLHTFTGQPWATKSGPEQLILKWCDKIIGHLNTRCYADSFSQKKFLVDSHIMPNYKLHVLGEGSLAGVDLQRFNPCRYKKEDNDRLKAELDVPQSSFIILFVGRVTREKGVFELIQAFSEIINRGVDAYLVFVGPFEIDAQQCLDSLKGNNVMQRMRIVGFSREPEKYMSISDVLCLPSYREGFGTVVIEAAAMGVPTIGTDIYGLSDAVVNGETGILVPVRDYKALALAMTSLAVDATLRAEMGINARKRVLDKFDSRTMGHLLMQEYKNLMADFTLSGGLEGENL
ncbi:glycosyltransferase family 4 protein [Desulfurivibrio sp. C05AmB]|uniref:glycosyltransferase family 4 protein n=1 Tax=Desulfurivibrio sp. C05AmB TaxID=3374371 RepID=UPI00376ECF4B